MQTEPSISTCLVCLSLSVSVSVSVGVASCVSMCVCVTVSVWVASESTELVGAECANPYLCLLVSHRVGLCVSESV